MAQLMDNEYGGTALIADPIHKYIQFTVPEKKGEVTEKALIDSPWVQRLRYIYQLQSARWVYPSAEHSRFQHSLGAMHMAGEFAKHLYPSLRKVLGDECPSAPFIEQYMRVVGLLHDIGHGPFGHFFDDNFLHTYDLTHEDLGQTIIQKHLGDPLVAGFLHAAFVERHCGDLLLDFVAVWIGLLTADFRFNDGVFDLADVKLP